MQTFQFSVRLTPELSEEVLRIAKTNRKSHSDVIRALVQDALARRAEESTNTQFSLVEKRLARIEERFAAWLIKLSKASAKSLFFTEQLALFEVEEEDAQQLHNAANLYVRRFLQKGGNAEEDTPDAK
jgi:Arc/MetJ-type ribon-helix-helix transcriptional regulator